MNNVSFSDIRIYKAWSLLRITYGLFFIITGADKFLGYLTQWPRYVNPQVPALLSLDVPGLMHAVGIFEVVVGILILIGLTRLGGFLAALWLVAIAVCLFFMRSYYDIALYDLVMAAGALALVKLTAFKNDID